MKKRFGGLMLALAAPTLLFLVACEQPQVSQTETAPAQEAPVMPVEPTPWSPELVAAVDEFVAQQQDINGEWLEIRDDFDQWSAGLSACLPNSMHSALNDFAIDFIDITEQARNVTRTQTTGELADTLILAAEDEEAAYRALRDRWQPNNVALFEQVEEKRAAASRAHTVALDKAIELRETFEDAPDADSISEFTLAFDAVTTDWEELHDEYTELREEAEALEVAEVLEGLDGIVKKSTEVIDALDELPHLAGTESVVDDLLKAAKAERKEFRAAAKPSTGAPASGGGTSSTAASSSTTASANGEAGAAASGTGGTSGSTSTETAPAPELPDFTGADESVEAGQTALKQASRVVRSIADVDVEKNLAELRRFNTEYNRLRDEWDDFHEVYNDWRQDGSGCDRAEVVAALDQYSLRIATLASQVRSLPQSGFLLPIYNLLVEAAAREEAAMRTLRYTWQPFAIDSFKALYEQRTITDADRREAGIALLELSNRP